MTLHDLAHDGRWGNVVTANARVAPDVEVRPGERVRVRLANVANGRVFAPDFGGLDAKLVAFDGHPTAAPLDPAGLELAPGNRADVEIVAPSDGRSIAVHDRFTGRALRLWSFVAKGGPVATAASSATFARVPAFADATALEPDAVFRLNATRGGPHGITWSLGGAPHAGHGGDPTHVFRVDRFAKVRFVNESARLHPMHLHGQVFKVVARDGAPVDERHLRDTVLVHPRETVDVGLVPHDLGSWVLHCHVLEHHDAGMMTVVAVRP